MNIYHAVVKKIARTNFDRVSEKKYDEILRACAPTIRHQFGGHHALGGIRNDPQSLKLWFERLGRLVPNIQITAQDIWVKGWPQNTTIFVRWKAAAKLLNGQNYENRGVHVIKMRWGKVFEIDAHEDSQAVAEALRIQAQHGINEALADPITS